MLGLEKPRLSLENSTLSLGISRLSVGFLNKYTRKKDMATRDDKGRFIKGGTKPEGSGIKKGSQQALTKKLKEIIREQLQTEIGQLGKTISEIDDPAQKVNAIAKVLPFVLPRIESVSFEETAKRDLTAEEKLLELNNTMSRTLEKQRKKLLETLTDFDDEEAEDEAE